MVLGNHGKPFTPRRSRIHSGSTRNVNPVSTNPNSSVSKMKVVVRCRPQNEKEIQSNQRKVIKFVDDQVLVFDPKENVEHFFYQGVKQNARDISKRMNKHLNFVFDNVFNFESTNQDIYESCMKDLLESIMKGYNCSVFVYGATGAGKTHTMLGSDTNPGITYLTMVGLFDKIRELEDMRTFDLAITYLEVYNENVHDLLKPSGPLHLREEAKGCVVVSGVSIHMIKSAEELLALLAKGNKNRTQHPTDANAESSRSHAVFQVHMRMTAKTSGEIKHMKLSMIDLAGSERASATGGLGARFKEGANINKSLLALANCINSLADGQKHIPYRDSKLTRLLKDSLGGNCKTVMIANISPSNVSYEDTYNTLKYATRAKNIKSTMTTNVVKCQKDITFYVERVKALQKELDELKAKQQPVKSYNIRAAVVQQAPKASPPMEVKKFKKYIHEKLYKQFSEVKSAQEKILLVQSLKKTLAYRSKLKTGICTRLNDILMDICDYDDSRARILGSISQFQKQMTGLDSRLSICGDNYKQNYEALKASVEEGQNNKYNINLDEYLNLEVMKLNNSALLSQIQHSQKLFSIEQNEMRNLSEMFVRGMQLLFRYHKCMKGHGHCNSQMNDEMKTIARQLEQGFKTVSWEEDNMPDDSELADIYTLTLMDNREDILEETDYSPLDKTRTFSIEDDTTDSPESIPDAEMNKMNLTPVKFTVAQIQEENDINVRQRVNLFKNPALGVKSLCNINNRLLKENVLLVNDTDSDNDFQCLSDTDNPDNGTEKTFLIPGRKMISNSSSSYSKRNILIDQKNKNSMHVKSTVKLFKSPKRLPIQKNVRENKENVLSKTISKTNKPTSTMGTASRFPVANKPLLKVKNAIRPIKTCSTSDLSSNKKPSPVGTSSSSLL